MKKLRTSAVEIVLKPGDFHFGGAELRLRTLLGSCVAITLWHPERRIGGMCHFVLPARPPGRPGELDGHYGEEAMALFLAKLRASGTQPTEYQAKLFGGGRMFEPAHGPAALPPDAFDVALRNELYARELVRTHGFQLVAEHLGGNGHRSVIFDVGSGEVWLRHVDRML